MAASNDYEAIKAGVNGLMDDAPGPSAEFSGGVDSQMMSGEGIPQPEVQQEEQAPTSYSNAENESYAGYDNSEVDKLHEIAEAIINEKWQELLSSVGNIAVWKEKVDTNIISIKQEIVRINERFDNLQNAILGKVKEYDTDMRNVSTEMKALEKVFERIIEPLTTNVKELGKITKDLKELR